MKVLFLAIFSYVLLLGDVVLTSNIQLVPTQAEINQMQKLWESRRLKIDSNEAEKLVKENRILSNALLEDSKAFDTIKTETTIFLEEFLADKKVKEYLKKTPINDKVTRSYYENNKVEFLQPSTITFRVYSFDQFDSALAFYSKVKNDPGTADIFVADNNISVDEQTMEYNKLHVQLQNLLIDKKSTGYFTPPQKFSKKYIVLKIVDLSSMMLIPYKEVKEEIKAKLYQKVINEKRNELIEKLTSEG